MSMRVGRPTKSPKNSRVTVRLDEESKVILERYCIEEHTDKAEAIRRGIKLLNQSSKK